VGDPPIGIAAISSALEPPSKTNAAMPAARVPDMAAASTGASTLSDICGSPL